MLQLLDLSECCHPENEYNINRYNQFVDVSNYSQLVVLNIPVDCSDVLLDFHQIHETLS